MRRLAITVKSKTMISTLNRTYDSLGLSLSGISRVDFLRRPLHFLRLVGMRKVDIPKQTKRMN